MTTRADLGLPPLDWAKPLMHADGQLVTLVETVPATNPVFPGCTRIVERDGEVPETALWWFHEDGICQGWPDKSLVNRPPGAR